jgi:hypothetical protein
VDRKILDEVTTHRLERVVAAFFQVFDKISYSLQAVVCAKRKNCAQKEVKRTEMCVIARARGGAGHTRVRAPQRLSVSRLVDLLLENSVQQ